MLKDILSSLSLPDFKSKEEMLDLLLREEYGYLPPKPDNIEWSESVVAENFCAGKARQKRVDITVSLYEEKFTFSVLTAIPKKEGKHPFFIHISFKNEETDKYMPVEEIIDRGFAVLSFCYKDVTSDDGDFNDGLAGVITRHEPRGATTPGKIAMWAWAAHRVLDYAYTVDALDKEYAVVCGHSRLGKTALLAAANDGRFKFAYSNNSGCSGAALSRGTKGETIKDICRVFPFWFCENYRKYADSEENMPFDQHWLMASIAPRYVYVASAEEDAWADPKCEFLTCVAVSSEYEKYGVTGFVCDDRLPVADDVYHEGSVGYHLRHGTHYFSREDWNKAIDFVRSKMK